MSCAVGKLSWASRNRFRLAGFVLSVSAGKLGLIVLLERVADLRTHPIGFCEVIAFVFECLKAHCDLGICSLILLNDLSLQ